MSQDNAYDSMFSGIIGEEYDMLKLISPFAVEMSRAVGETVADCAKRLDQPLQVVELGGGTGITTLALLSADSDLIVLSIDNSPTMQNQAKQHLKTWEESGRLSFSGEDVLSALKHLPPNSVNVIASAYTLHNLEAQYRNQVLIEAFRVLKPGGEFINGDRYALDDVAQHTRNTQHEVAGYFKILTEIDRLDLLEHWIIHLFSDESEDHIMREAMAIRQMKAAGFSQIEVKQRQDVNALLTAIKPA